MTWKVEFESDPFLKKLKEITPELKNVPHLSVQAHEYIVSKGTCFVMPILKNEEVGIVDAFLSEGTVFPKHIHKVHEYLIITEGLVEVKGLSDGLHATDDYAEKNRFGKGSIVYLAPGVEHEVTAIRETRLIGVTVPADEGYPG